MPTPSLWVRPPGPHVFLPGYSREPAGGDGVVAERPARWAGGAPLGLPLRKPRPGEVGAPASWQTLEAWHSGHVQVSNLHRRTGEMLCAENDSGRWGLKGERLWSSLRSNGQLDEGAGFVKRPLGKSGDRE